MKSRRARLAVRSVVAVLLIGLGFGLAGCEGLRIRGSGGDRGIHDIKIGIPI